MGARNGLPDFVYDATVVSDREKDQAKEMIKILKEKILIVSDRNNIGSPNVFIPFREAIEKSLPTEKASDMTTAQRLYNSMTLLPVINIDKRPRLITRSEGDPILKTCPFAVFEDLKESSYLMEYSNGVRPYILEWYNEVFLVEFNDKRERNIGNNGENLMGVSTRELVDSTFRIRGQKYSTKKLLENYLVPLINAGYIDKIENRNDKRSFLFYPVLNVKQKKLFDVGESTNFSLRKDIHTVNSTIFSDKSYLISKIQEVIEYSKERHKLTRLEDSEGQEVTVEELVNRYYRDPEEYFEVDGGNTAPDDTNDRRMTATTALAISRTSVELAKSLNPR
jgi:hypothetical protein